MLLQQATAAMLLAAGHSFILSCTNVRRTDTRFRACEATSAQLFCAAEGGMLVSYMPLAAWLEPRTNEAWEKTLQGSPTSPRK